MDASVVLTYGGTDCSRWPDAARGHARQTTVSSVVRGKSYTWPGNLHTALQDLKESAFLLCEPRMVEIVDLIARTVSISDDEGPTADGAAWNATLNPVLRELHEADLGYFLRSHWPVDTSAPNCAATKARTLAAAETSSTLVRRLDLRKVRLCDWERVHALVRCPERFSGRIVIRDTYDVPWSQLPPDTFCVNCHLAGHARRARLFTGVCSQAQTIE